MEAGTPTWYMYENYVISVRLEYVENDVVQQCDFFQPLPADELLHVHSVSNVLPQMPPAEGEEESLLVPMQQPITVADVERMIHDMHNGADGIIQMDPFNPYDYDLYEYDMEEEENEENEEDEYANEMHNGADGIIQPDPFNPYDYDLYEYDMEEEENEEDEYANDADDESDDGVSMASYADYSYFLDDWYPFEEMFDDEVEECGGGDDYDDDDDDIHIDDVNFDDAVDDFGLFDGEGWDGVIVWDNPQMELSDDSGAYDDDEASSGE